MLPYQGPLPDEGLHVEFYFGSIQDDAASASVGHPMFKEVPFVRIAIPGNRDEIIDTVAWLDEGNQNSHINRFPNAWKRFQERSAEDAVTGFPLKEWAVLTRSQVEHLAYFKIRTVEQFANVTDGNLQKIGHGLGGRGPELRQKARDFLVQANSAEAMRAELEALKAQMASLQSPGAKVTVLPQAAEGQVLTPATETQPAPSTAPRKRGRPAKTAPAAQP